MTHLLTSRFARGFVAAVAACFATSSGSALAANIVVNGDLETGSFAPWVYTQSAPNAAWTADPTGGGGGFQTTQLNYPGAATMGSFAIQFGGFESFTPTVGPNTGVLLTDPVGDTVIQTLATTPGASYTLSFVVNDNGSGDATNPAQLAVDWNGSNVVTVNWPPTVTTSTWTSYSFTVTATGSSTPLEFAGYGPAFFTSVDNISAVQIAPEPGSLLLLTAGAVGLWFAARRRA